MIVVKLNLQINSYQLIKSNAIGSPRRCNFAQLSKPFFQDLDFIIEFQGYQGVKYFYIKP